MAGLEQSRSGGSLPLLSLAALHAGFGLASAPSVGLRIAVARGATALYALTRTGCGLPRKNDRGALRVQQAPFKQRLDQPVFENSPDNI